MTSDIKNAPRLGMNTCIVPANIPGSVIGNMTLRTKLQIFLAPRSYDALVSE